MTLIYQIELWAACWPELEPHWQAHWAEVALDQAAMPLEVDMPRYHQMATDGTLHVVTVRTSAGALVGYAVWIISTHLHYRQTLCGFSDVYYLAPAYRKGAAGVRLFRESVTTLRHRGVQKLFIGTKVSLDVSRLFERLGFVRTEILYTKYIGDSP